ncbi:hypothetical protein C453_17454 [Haloferax elongans ATCC BAA-1513]|uniref:ArsR family transcriptional regulator n=1 Tax=Haloferax elongans ATCC BAA-1513 TaxID=1230453 RepID=M0HBF0_HALEO|nr:hypothetical protein C453_17454 [Haloferax elongans ATCC BAA-1513]
MTVGNQIDRALDAVSHTYRRRLLVALLDHSPRYGMGALRAGNGVGTDLQASEIQLFHSHLPKLEKQGYITWNRESGEFGKGPNWGEVEPLLRLLRDYEDDRP